MVVTLLLVLISVFVALNMGVSGFSVSFAPSYGSRVLNKTRAAVLYGLCVFLGGLLIGPRVVGTLVNKISLEHINPTSGLLILFSAGAMIFLSNILKIPQSTSFVTVASFLGAGLYYGKVNWHTVSKIIIVAAVFSALSFIITYLIKRKIYPPHRGNLHLYEKFHIHRNKVKNFIIWTDMYSAFGIGTNNVANVVAPLVGSLAISPFSALGLSAPLFGLGAYFFGGRVLKTVSRDIVPIGEMSAAIVSSITATFVIIASLLGLPAPYVQFTTFSVLAISSVKDGAKHTAGKSVFKRIVSAWICVPIATVFLSFLLHLFFVKR
ncbi:MAG: inorganic phosphate transporter family protein [Candidatus Omnitrophica bacterium]|nr:inorganic phosphate transporter family protein [Candidatus Omnitrophota bacterium]